MYNGDASLYLPVRRSEAVDDVRVEEHVQTARRQQLQATVESLVVLRCHYAFRYPGYS